MKNKYKSEHKTSWNKVSKWYTHAVGKEGHFFHQSVITPNVLRLLDLKTGGKVLDIASGQGILERALPKDVEYLGIDIASDLIKYAKENKVSNAHNFAIADASKAFDLGEKFSHATIILALQNIENYSEAIQNAAKHLKENGKLVIVINHPYFRIPKFTSWEIDEQHHIQYRRVDKYLSASKIKIDMTPGGDQATNTLSFHVSLQDYTKALRRSGFAITHIEEWISPKKSEGKHANMENTARKEFPMFMCLVAVKTSLYNKS